METELLMIGASHRRAGVDARGRLAAACGHGPVAVAAIAAACPAVRELLVLSTCHRVELYAAVSDVTDATPQLLGVLRGAGPIDETALSIAAGEDVARHLCRVASGLESLVLGEAEIAGQVRRAAVTGRQAGTVGTALEAIVAGALAASGRARSQTHIGSGALSASTAAVAWVEQQLGDLSDRVVLVVGAGEAGRHALERLAKRGTGALLVASRSRHHATDAAARTGATAIALDKVAVHLPNVDAVIAATMADAHVVRPEGMASRAARPLVLMDLSVPRVLDPSLADLEGVTLRTVDDLGDIVRATIARRTAEVPRVEAIAAAEARRAFGEFTRRQISRLRRGSGAVSRKP